jgi:hypothetical protein
VERAQALEARAGLAQLNALTDQLGEVDLPFDFSCYANGRGGSPALVVMDSSDETPDRLPASRSIRQRPDTRIALSSLDKASGR